ncbi:phosphotransferase family protein [Streptomyces rhizosphaerihabitans]|uniref:phosphotransferase family protein n=1 Tax=Streptomyces rhizosphaerihabitans TaxID=1266770 RepID=UPI0021C2128B|nr:aminoglycoside phosphotransferase family protein [Streptomyces rhizosphaerihabitans]MCT9010869.1 aminoglycoside phosphotransferase family protein [Streptomyces rhizosphaerihabitans]
MDSWERARWALERAGLSSGSLAERRALSGGTYNAVEELRLADGSRYVLKVPPPDTVPALAYERRLLLSEAEFCRQAVGAGVPAPRTVGEPGDGHLLMTYCPGEPWGDLPDGERGPLRQELGRMVARLHAVVGPGFGYPSGALGPLAPDWRTAFTGMYDAVLDDARRYRAWLPRPVDEVARVARTVFDALDDVTVPRLVHFDLWQGNILVERTKAGPRIGGLIDGERMLWGDPLADFVSLALLGDIRRDEDFLAGYQEVRGGVEFDESARRRLALYRSYLYLIMLVETVPRAPGDEKVAWVREAVAPQLTDALDEIGRSATAAADRNG